MSRFHRRANEQPAEREEPEVVVNETPAFLLNRNQLQRRIDLSIQGVEFTRILKRTITSNNKTVSSVHQPYTPTYTYKDENAQVWPKVIGVLLVLALIGIGIWYFAVYGPKQLAKEEQEQKELLAIQEEARQKEDERQAAKQKEDEQEAAAAQRPPAPAIGTIETLSGRSGRYYVVVASSIDGDLIMDYAKKLSGKA